METIFEAIAARSPERVGDAIRASGDLVATTTRDPRGWTSLMAASAEGHLEIVILILQASKRAVGVDGLRALSLGPNGADAFELAARSEHGPTHQILSVTIPVDGRLPGFEEPRVPSDADFGEGATIDRLVTAASQGRVEEVEFCLARGVPVEGLSRQSYRAMEKAIKNGHVDVVRLLLKAGADPDKRSSFDTGLSLAAKAGHAEVVRCLVEGGADVNLRDWYLHTPLRLAIEANDPAMIEILTIAGAVDPNADRIDLRAAARRGDEARVRELIGRGVHDWFGDPSWRRTALEEAVEGRHSGIVDILLQAGALGRQAAESRANPLIRAGYHDDAATVRLLIGAGADPNLVDAGGATALCYPARAGNLEIVDLLLDAGADPNLVGGGSSVYEFAIRGGNVAVIARLLDRGRPGRNAGRPVEKLRGVESFDVTADWLLVRATVEEAARAFAETRGQLESWDRGLASILTPIGPHAYLACRLRGHAWTLIYALKWPTWVGSIVEVDAVEVSRGLGVRTIFHAVRASDESLCTTLCEAGEVLERIEFAWDPRDDDEPESPGGPAEVELVEPPHDQVVGLICDEGAYVPAFWSLFGLIGEAESRLDLIVGGLDLEDFDRIDVLRFRPASDFEADISI